MLVRPICHLAQAVVVAAHWHGRVRVQDNHMGNSNHNGDIVVIIILLIITIVITLMVLIIRS